GWVNRMYLATEAAVLGVPSPLGGAAIAGRRPAEPPRDPPEAPRTCLTPPARALLERIEERFGPVQLVSTCRPGATIAATGRPSRHASGNAIDFNAGGRKAEIVQWLIDNHHDGGTMTYAEMDHIHVDIGAYFLSIAGGPHAASWRSNPREFPVPRRRTGEEDD